MSRTCTPPRQRKTLRKQDKPTSEGLRLGNINLGDDGRILSVLSKKSRQSSVILLSLSNPLNLIEGPALERAATLPPLQLSTRTPSPPSTPPRGIKFVKAQTLSISS